LWFFAGAPIVRCQLLPFSSVRRFILRCFGAKVERGVVLKPGVRVKYPWRLSIGAHSWIGEDVWIDNLVEVRIGANACLSQGAYLCTGNHDWSDEFFGLQVLPIGLLGGRKSVDMSRRNDWTMRRGCSRKCGDEIHTGV